jgi:hypothetical protein
MSTQLTPRHEAPPLPTADLEGGCLAAIYLGLHGKVLLKRSHNAGNAPVNLTRLSSHLEVAAVHPQKMLKGATSLVSRSQTTISEADDSRSTESIVRLAPVARDSLSCFDHSIRPIHVYLLR